VQLGRHVVDRLRRVLFRLLGLFYLGCDRGFDLLNVDRGVNPGDLILKRFDLLIVF